MTNGLDSTVIIAIVVIALALAALAFMLRRASRLGRERKPVLSERAKDERPYVRAAAPDAPLPAAPPPAPAAEPVHRGVADEVATAANDVVGDVLGVDTQGPGERSGDDLQKLKGCGPKLASRLHELGITRYAQLASLGETEIAMLDEKLGPFRGRIARDRLAEQATYLARGDVDGFEQHFGKLGGA
jgi:predicted flap endonuclease-1-like 5' DNA nuclease